MTKQALSSWLMQADGWYSRGRVTRTINARSGLVYGTYLPDATTTGILSAPTTLVTTNQTLSDTGAASEAKTFTNTEFRCTVYLTGKNYTFKNCLFSGPAAGTTNAMVQARYATSEGHLFEDCTFAPYTVTYGCIGLQGRGFTASRCNVYGSVDGIDPAPADGGTRTDVIIQQSYIHDLARYCPYSGQSDNQTHSDAIQWMGGLGLTLLGNRIEGLIDTAIGTGWATATYDGSSVLTGGHPYYPNPVSTSALMINALGGTIQPGELIMRKNWIRGGTVGINSVGVTSAFLTSDGVTVIDGNHIVRDQASGSGGYRWYGKSTQACIDNAMSAGTNYAWNTSSPLDNTTVITGWKVNG